MNQLKPKFFTTLKGYTAQQFTRDAIAGIIVAIIALPLSIALAIASGVNPEQGLYTAIFAGFFISFLGGSRVQIGGPTAAFVVIIYGIVADYGMNGLTVATLMAGAMMILMGLLRLGNLIKFIPKTITIGSRWESRSASSLVKSRISSGCRWERFRQSSWLRFPPTRRISIHCSGRHCSSAFWPC